MSRLSFVKNYVFAALLVVIVCMNISWSFNKGEQQDASIKNQKVNASIIKTNNQPVEAQIYDSLHLNAKGLSKAAFDYALEGMRSLKEQGIITNDSILTIVDFDQPSYNKRMYVLDVKNFRILFNTWAAHGKNSGREMAQSFSNTDDSNKSSLGFYVTKQTYNGSKGFSLKLEGLEKNLNDHAYERAIVLHGASYVSQSAINSMGCIGRSHGCPAVPVELNRPIINKIKNGSCLFIYNKRYKPSASLMA